MAIVAKVVASTKGTRKTLFKPGPKKVLVSAGLFLSQVNTKDILIAKHAAASSEAARDVAIEQADIATTKAGEANSDAQIASDKADIATDAATTATNAAATATTKAGEASSDAQLAAAERQAAQDMNAEVLSLPLGNGYTAATVASAATVVVDVSQGAVLSLTLTVPDTTLTIATPTLAANKSSYCSLILKQGTGANKVTWPNNIKWPHGRAPVLAYELDAEDVITLMTVGTSGVWYGFVGGSWF